MAYVHVFVVWLSSPDVTSMTGGWLSSLLHPEYGSTWPIRGRGTVRDCRVHLPARPPPFPGSTILEERYHPPWVPRGGNYPRFVPFFKTPSIPQALPTQLPECFSHHPISATQPAASSALSFCNGCLDCKRESPEFAHFEFFSVLSAPTPLH